jgi:hypothetical protein
MLFEELALALESSYLWLRLRLRQPRIEKSDLLRKLTETELRRGRINQLGIIVTSL